MLIVIRMKAPNYEKFKRPQTSQIVFSSCYLRSSGQYFSKNALVMGTHISEFSFVPDMHAFACEQTF